MFLLNPFTSEFLKWTVQCLNLDTSIIAKRTFSLKSKTYSTYMRNTSTTLVTFLMTAQSTMYQMGQSSSISIAAFEHISTPYPRRFQVWCTIWFKSSGIAALDPFDTQYPRMFLCCSSFFVRPCIHIWRLCCDCLFFSIFYEMMVFSVYSLESPRLCISIRYHFQISLILQPLSACV